MKADSMVAEYRGELVRPTVANVKEKRYRAAGMDCYLFAISDHWVIDATRSGTIARFTVGFSTPAVTVSSHPSSIVETLCCAFPSPFPHVCPWGREAMWGRICGK